MPGQESQIPSQELLNKMMILVQRAMQKEQVSPTQVVNVLLALLSGTLVTRVISHLDADVSEAKQQQLVSFTSSFLTAMASSVSMQLEVATVLLKRFGEPQPPGAEKEAD